MNAWWSWALTAVGVFGLYLAGRKSPWGWAVGIGAQVLWFAYAVATRQWGFVASCIAYGAVYVRNFRAWRARPAEPPTGDHTFPIAGGEVTVTAPMSEADYEALKTRWLKEHGSPHAAHRVTELKPHPAEEAAEVSSNYSVLCLSHDPAIIVHDPGYNRAEQAEAAIRDGINGHETCDLMIGRYSYPLIELGCPAAPGRPKHLRPGVITCYHGSTQWTDRDWLWILAAAYQSPDPDLRTAIEKGHQQQCLPWERLRRLRVELGITVKEESDA